MVSKITPTTIMIEVPPKDTCASNHPEKKIGIIATILKPSAPMKITLLRILFKYSVVGLPGLIPGIKPPDFFILLAISIGLNVIEV